MQGPHQKLIGYTLVSINSDIDTSTIVKYQQFIKTKQSLRLPEDLQDIIGKLLFQNIDAYEILADDLLESFPMDLSDAIISHPSVYLQSLIDENIKSGYSDNMSRKIRQLVINMTNDDTETYFSSPYPYLKFLTFILSNSKISIPKKKELLWILFQGSFMGLLIINIVQIILENLTDNENHKLGIAVSEEYASNNPVFSGNPFMFDVENDDTDDVTSILLYIKHNLEYYMNPDIYDPNGIFLKKYNNPIESDDSYNLNFKYLKMAINLVNV